MLFVFMKSITTATKKTALLVSIVGISEVHDRTSYPTLC